MTSEALPFFTTPKLVRDTEHLRVFDLGCWRWILAKTAAPYEIHGKYVFLSRDRVQLERLAEREILENDFHMAKVSHTLNQGDFVLCLYDADARRAPELARIAQAHGWKCEPTSRHRWTLPAGTLPTTLRFRWWKAEEDTRSEIERALTAK